MQILGFKSKIEKSVTNDDPENVLLLLSEIHNLPIDKVSLKETKIGAYEEKGSCQWLVIPL